uniref:Gustatory receptor n=1 Tax=Plectus sambesii TaxID=2011161 RepID=A0A914WTM5_9BILA
MAASLLIGNPSQPDTYIVNGGMLYETVDRNVIKHRLPTLEQRLAPTLRVLQIFGFFPLCVNTKAACVRQRIEFLLWTVMILGLLFLNAFLFKLNIETIWLYSEIFEWLHAQTICSIINGLKPLIAGVSMIIFWLQATKHRRFLKRLTQIDAIFRAEFGASPDVRKLNIFVVAVTVVVLLFVCTIRSGEFYFNQEQLGSHLLVDLSLIIVPLLSLWVILPIVYFEVCNQLVRFWTRQLQQAIKRDGQPGRHARRSVKFYYEQFLHLCGLQNDMSNLFNPFILFALGWSVFSLCLTIYFVTQTDAHFPEIPSNETFSGAESITSQEWFITVSFNMMYGFLQITMAAGHVCVLCFTGTRTNERTRAILAALLSTLPEEESAADRFYVTCFMFKINTQYMWGVTAWRAFPFERGAFFTLVSLILTYSVLLLKFRNERRGTPSLTAQEIANSTPDSVARQEL